MAQQGYYPGVIKVDEGTPGISLGHFQTVDAARHARNGFLESVQLPQDWEESDSPMSAALSRILRGSNGPAPVYQAPPASVIPPPPSIPHISDVAGLAPPVATDHPPEMAHIPQTSGAEQGMLQHQSFQAMHNDTMQTHSQCMDLGGPHNEPELNRGKRNHGLPKGITRRPNSVKYECKVHLSGKRFYVGLFSTVEEALQAQAEKRQQLVDAASRDPDGKIEVATRTTGEDEMVKVKAAVATGSSLEKVKGLRKRKNGRWETQIMHKGTRHYLGTFDTAEEALDARNRRARELSITEATLPSRSPTAKRAKRAHAAPAAPPTFQGAPAAVPMIAPHVALAYQQGMAPVVYPGQIPGSKDVVQYQTQLMYHHHPSTAPGSLQQQHIQQVHMQQPHVPLPEGAQPPNAQNVSTGIPCSIPQAPQESHPHELTSLRAMMSNPANVLNMMSGNRNGSMPAGAGAASHGVPAPMDGAAIPPPMVATVNGMPTAMPLPNAPDSSHHGAMYSDAAPGMVPPAPESVPGSHDVHHDIPGPHHGSPMLVPAKLETAVDDSSGVGVVGTHTCVLSPESAAHALPADVPAPVSPEDTPVVPPAVPPAIPDVEGSADKALSSGEGYGNEDPALHQFAVSSEAGASQTSFHSPAFAGLSSADANMVNTSGDDVSHLIPVPSD